MTNVIIYVQAVDDVYGDPRRGWIIPGAGPDGSDVFVDEGYADRWSLYEYLDMGLNNPDALRLRGEYESRTNEVVLSITVSQYNKLRKGE